MLGAALGNDTIELVQIRVEIEDFQRMVQVKRLTLPRWEINVLLTATHSMMSTYFGNITIVLKFPFTRAASTNGRHRYKGFRGAGGGIAAAGDGRESAGENVAEVGVGDRLGRWARVMERLER